MLDFKELTLKVFEYEGTNAYIKIHSSKENNEIEIKMILILDKKRVAYC